MKKSRNLFLAVFVLFLVSACENNREPVVTTFTFKEVSNIFKTHDCGKCHDSQILGPGVTLKSDPFVYSDVLNNWVLKTPKPETAITLTDYKKSNLYLAFHQNGTDLKQMAAASTTYGTLTPTELSIIDKWLEAGAPEK